MTIIEKAIAFARRPKCNHQMSVRLPADLHVRLRALAEKNGVSVNSLIGAILITAIEDRGPVSFIEILNGRESA